MVANRLRTEALNLHMRELTCTRAFGRPQILQFVNQKTPYSDGEDGLHDMRLMRQIYATAGMERL